MNKLNSPNSVNFECRPEVYHIRDFHDQFGKALPLFIQVVLGYCGETEFDTFESDMVLRIEAKSKQSRVVAKTSSSNCGHLTIPLDYELKFCAVEKNGKYGKPSSLKEIIKKERLPVKVKPAVSESGLGQLILTSHYHESYLLANTWDNGGTGLSQNSMAIPLYLPMRVSVIKGFKDKDSAAWTNFTKRWTKFVTTQKFDKSKGNPDIAVYTESIASPYSEVEYDKRGQEHVYDCIIPREFMRTVGQGHQTENVNLSDMDSPNRKESADGVYSTVSTNEEVFVSDHKYYKLQESRLSAMLPDEEPDQLTGAWDSQKDIEQKEGEARQSANREVAGCPDDDWKPALPSRIRSDDGIRERESAGFDRCLRELKLSTSEAEHSGKQHTIPDDNDVSRAVVNPFQRQISKDKSAVPESFKISIAALTIEEVGDCLSKLSLDKYCEKFREEMVNGSILLQFDGELLRDEFGFSRLETIRLMTFINEGRMPR